MKSLFLNNLAYYKRNLSYYFLIFFLSFIFIGIKYLNIYYIYLFLIILINNIQSRRYEYEKRNNIDKYLSITPLKKEDIVNYYFLETIILNLLVFLITFFIRILLKDNSINIKIFLILPLLFTLVDFNDFKVTYTMDLEGVRVIRFFITLIYIIAFLIILGYGRTMAEKNLNILLIIVAIVMLMLMILLYFKSIEKLKEGFED